MIIFFMIFLGVITYINFSEAKDYREKIISNQMESLFFAKQKIGAIYKLDSVIAISQSQLDNANSDSLRSNRDSLLYINYIISHREELKRSSDALKQDLDATEKDTKSMIDIHLQYIDQQYSTLSLWAGIITIVFLIFSFYAVFKQEDAINKAYAIIDKLNNKLSGLDENIRSKMDKIEEDFNSSIKDINNKSAQEIDKLSRKSTDLINEIKGKAVAETKNIVQEADKQRKINQLTYEADDYRKEEKYELALQKIDEAINIDNENSYLYYMKAFIAHKLDNYNLAIECYKKSAEKILDNYSIFYNWGNAILSWAQIKNDEKLFAASCEKYQRAAEINPEDDRILNNWGSTLCSLAQIKNDLNSDKQQIESILLKAEAIKEGSGSYNLACLYLLLEQKDVALIWLDKRLRIKLSPGKEHILTDSDLDNIKSDPRFNELLDKYFPEK